MAPRQLLPLPPVRQGLVAGRAPHAQKCVPAVGFYDGQRAFWGGTHGLSLLAENRTLLAYRFVRSLVLWRECLAPGLQGLWYLFIFPLVISQQKCGLSLLCSCCLISEPELSPAEGLGVIAWSWAVDRGEKALFSWAWEHPLATLFPQAFSVTKFISYSHNHPRSYDAYTKILLLELWAYFCVFLTVKVCCCLQVVLRAVRDGL